MTETTLSNIYQEIIKTGIYSRNAIELLTLLDLAYNKKSVVNYWVENIRRIGDRIFSFNDGIPPGIKRKFWKLTTEEKLVLGENIRNKRKRLLKSSNLDGLLTSMKKYCTDYEQCLNLVFRAIKNNDKKMIDENFEKAARIGGFIEKTFQKAGTTQRKYISILFEAIDSRR